MYARHISIKSTPENLPKMEALADKVFEYLKTLDGFVSAHFLISADHSEYGTISLWETKEHAESAGESLQAMTKESLQEVAIEAPVIKMFEVYKPGS